MSKWLWYYRQLQKKLWFRATLYCSMALMAVLAARVFEPLIPADLPQKVGAQAVDQILNIMASSLLTVTIFSLTIMVSATAAASSSATPRVTKLLVEDTITQRTLSTFLGAFLFSLVGLLTLHTGVFTQPGKLVLLGFTVGMIVIIVVVLLRWINYLSTLGRVSMTIDRTEETVIKAMRDYRDNPLFGGNLRGDIPEDTQAVYANSIGYIEHLNMTRLSQFCKEHDAKIHVTMRPGGFAEPSRPVAHIETAGAADLSDDDIKAVANAFTIADSRSFEQDPRFGLIVLCEIALRALSPAVNDPGTAIDVIGTQVRVLAVAAKAITYDEQKAQEKIVHPNVLIPSLSVKDFIEDAFMPLTRDAATMLEVNIKIQKACKALSVLNEDFRKASYDLARLSLRRAIESMPFEPDHARLKEEVAFEELLDDTVEASKES